MNTRVTLSGLSRKLGKHATLDDFPDSELVRLAGEGFDWIWFLGVWQTGPAGRKVSLSHEEWQAEYRQLLPDFQEEDVCGSCFAIRDYSAHVDFGGDAALGRLRDRVHSHGMRLLLDFVPNHTAPDHPWVQEHPEFYIHGNEELLAREPQNYARVTTPNGEVILAFGRDPYFDGWPDTFQLNYAEPSLQEEQARVLEKIATLCDGVRCDMAMLVLPDVFERTCDRCRSSKPLRNDSNVNSAAVTSRKSEFGQRCCARPNRPVMTVGSRPLNETGRLKTLAVRSHACGTTLCPSSRQPFFAEQRQLLTGLCRLAPAVSMVKTAEPSCGDHCRPVDGFISMFRELGVSFSRNHECDLRGGSSRNLERAAANVVRLMQ